jgi:uncharacterized protein YaeQ
MALTSTMYNLSVELSDVDRAVYESLELRMAMHPSESPEYFVTRFLAYCLEYAEGIEFGAGLSTAEDPAVLVRDLTGRITHWIEVGAPDADRLHRASKLADRVAVYTHREIRNVLGQLQGKKIHRADELRVFSFPRAFIEAFAKRLQRRMRITLSVTERHLYLDVDGTAFETQVDEHRLGVSS